MLQYKNFMFKQHLRQWRNVVHVCLCQGLNFFSHFRQLRVVFTTCTFFSFNL